MINIIVIYKIKYVVFCYIQNATKIKEVLSTERSRNKTPSNLKRLKNISEKPGFILEGKEKKLCI